MSQTSRPPTMASTLVAELERLIAEHGDHPVLTAWPDIGAFDIDLPRFDSDGDDACFLL